MNFSVIPSDKFKKEARRLIKKFPSLKAELTKLAKTLSAEPTSGTALGEGLYKIRLAIKSKGKGKSGGARVITYVVTDEKEVYLLTIYDKSELANVDDKTLTQILKTLNTNTE